MGNAQTYFKASNSVSEAITVTIVLLSSKQVQIVTGKPMVLCSDSFLSTLIIWV